jgi:hypothetical protein
MAAKITKTVVTPGSTFEIGEFKGRPVVTITLPGKEGTEYVDRVIFGARKAYAVLEHLDSIREFVAQLCETEAEAEPVAAKSPMTAAEIVKFADSFPNPDAKMRGLKKAGITLSQYVEAVQSTLEKSEKRPKASEFAAKPAKPKAKPAKAKVARR